MTELKIKYFDTVPVAASLCVLKTGFLFCASEFGNQYVVCICLIHSLHLLAICSALYQIAHLGDDDGEPEYSSAMQLEEGETFFFAPRSLKNLVLVDELESLSPIMACQVWDCNHPLTLII